MKPVLIYVRFSLLVRQISHSWKAARVTGSEEAYMATILDPLRLESRAGLFFTYSLPLLEQAVAQHPDLAIKVMLHGSDRLPLALKQRFADYSATHSWLSAEYFDYEASYNLHRSVNHLLASDSALAALDAPTLMPTMRLDDDDFMSPHYFTLLKKYIDPAFANMTFHTPRGFEGLYHEGQFRAVSPLDAPCTGIGLAHMATYDPQQKKITSEYLIPPGKHSITDMRAPVILDGSMPVIFRTKHIHNDAGLKGDGSGHYTEDLDRTMRRFFKEPADKAELLKYFPVLEGKL